MLPCLDISCSMHRRLTRLIIAFSFVAFLTTSDVANARSFLDFLKAVGNSIAHPQKKSRTPGTKSKEAPKAPNKDVAATPTPTVAAASPGPQNVRSASAAPQSKGGKGDTPYGIPVPGKQGFVTSPFAPEAGYVDVRKFPPGTEVKDPFSGKIFRAP